MTESQHHFQCLPEDLRSASYVNVWQIKGHFSHLRPLLPCEKHLRVF